MAGTKDAAKRVGTLALAALLVVSMLGASGMAAAHDKGMSADDSGHDHGADADDGHDHGDDKADDGMKGGDGDDGDNGDAVFSEEITVSFAGVTVTLGPPQDLNDDGVYADVTGDGTVNLIDGAAHAGIVAAVNQGALDLNEEQRNALDIDRDGDLDFQDSIALAQMA
jgi:hypothetical protein